MAQIFQDAYQYQGTKLYKLWFYPYLPLNIEKIVIFSTYRN